VTVEGFEKPFGHCDEIGVSKFDDWLPTIGALNVHVRELNPCHKGHCTQWRHIILPATHTLVLDSLCLKKNFKWERRKLP